MIQLLETGAAGLRDSFGAPLLLPGDDGYDQARSIWNGAIDRRPALIARCAGAADVSAAVRFARDHGLQVSVRGGGHGFAGHAVADGGLMIDLSPMHEVSVDAAARRALVGGGASLADLDAATQAHGLAVPAGTVSHTGIGGLTLGGGAGWLTAKAGLTIDNLLSAEVVTADGSVLTASADTHPDLFWAIRGGGGNFGVVTSFEFRLHQVGPMVNLGFFFWGIDRGAEALRHVREHVWSLPADMGVMLVGLNAPPAPFVPEEHRGVPGFALLVVGFGSPEDHRRAVGPLREACLPLFELVTPIPFAQLQQILDDGAPWGVRAYDKGLYVDDLTDDVIEVFTEHLASKRSPMSIVPCMRLSGAYERVGDDETAFSGRRRACYAVAITALAPTEELLAADREWVRAFWSALRPRARDAGAYVNFLGVADDDAVRASYGAEKYERLSRLKAAYDPDNVFRLNANIKPAAFARGRGRS